MQTSAATLTESARVSDELPYSIHLDLIVKDPEVLAELYSKSEGDERDEYALAALRLGVLALRQARGQIDAHAIRREGEKLLDGVCAALNEHRTHLDRTLVGTFKDFLDPTNGRLAERLRSLLNKDGELAMLLDKKIAADDSEMSRVLLAHIGKESPLLRMLSPSESEGILKSLRVAISTELETQRKNVLQEFSLDNAEGSLSRLLLKLADSNGQLTKAVESKIADVLKQFSFDDDQSAISRMAHTVSTTNDAISKHLTLDDENSALSRLRRELMGVLELYGAASAKFQEEVRITLEKMQTRRAEIAASPRHGINFEAQVLEIVTDEAQCAGDIAESVGTTVGKITKCKRLGISVAKALCTRQQATRDGLSADFTDVDKALSEIQRHVEKYDEIRQFADTIKSSSEKILERVRISKESVEKQVRTLSERIGDMKQLLSSSAVSA